MDFEFNDDQELLRDSVRRYLADRAPITWVRAQWARSATPNDDEVWKGLAALGVCGLLVPESCGGAAMTMVDAAVVLEELGRAVYPGPYATSAIAATTLLLHAGTPDDHARWLPALASGDAVATVALHEPGRRYDWRTPSAHAERDGGGAWRLTGTKAHVPHGARADLLLVVARDPGTGLGVFAVEADADGLTTTPDATIDAGHPTAAVALDGVRAVRLGRADADVEAAIGTAVDHFGVAECVDAVGAAARALELAVEYGHERVAFGRPIGSFQAVQHLCADMLRAVELGRAASYYACWALGAGDRAEAHRAATLALAHCTSELPKVGGDAVQVFAGVGFTWEHDVHLFYKRLVHVGYALGAADDYLDELASIVIGAGG